MNEPDPAPDRVPPLAAELLAFAADWAQVLDRLTRRHGQLSLAQYRVLDRLAAAAPEPCEPWELAGALRLSSAHISAVLDQLAGRGLIERAVHPDDARRRQVALTAAGHERHGHVAAMLTAVSGSLLDDIFSARERSELTELVGRSRAALERLALPEGRPRAGP